MIRTHARLCLIGLTALAAANTLIAQRSTANPFGTVALMDGTVVPVADISFNGPHRRDPIYTVGRSPYNADLLMREGQYWRIVPVAVVDSLTCRQQREWLQCDLAMRDSIVRYRGEIALRPEDTWLNGNGFELIGTTRILGSEAQFRAGLHLLRSVVRQRDS